MTDITDEQRTAWNRIEQRMGEVENPEVDRADWALLAPLLPSELTNPQPVLPTEPGTTIYGGRDQPRTMFRLDYGSSPRHWIDQYGERRTDAEARDLMGEWEETPPSVPERPQITREQVQALINQWYDHGSNGRLADCILALTNGATSD